MPKPVTPKASDAACHLLAQLYANSGQRTLSAQHDFITSKTRYRDQVATLTGQAPAIFGSDFSFIYRGSKPSEIGHCGPANMAEPGHAVARWAYDPARIFSPESPHLGLPANLPELRQQLVERCIALHRAGVVITLMWHCPQPGCGDVSGDGDLWSHGKFTEVQWRAVLTQGSDLHTAWQEQVDNLAPYLKTLAAAKVPVLWRPYHEMNGAWFWWGQRTTSEWGYARLWRQLFERLTQHHKLDNLLWVWNPNAPRDTPGDEAGPYADYYPGHDVVDVLATDVYHNEYRDSHYDELRALAEGRPLALGEVGQLPSPDLLLRQPRWSWIMPWGGLLFRFNSDAAIQTLYKRLSHHLN